MYPQIFPQECERARADLSVFSALPKDKRKAGLLYPSSLATPLLDLSAETKLTKKEALPL